MLRSKPNQNIVFVQLRKPYNFRHLSSMRTAYEKHVSCIYTEKTQASKLSWSESHHHLMPSNKITIKSTKLFGFLIDRSPAVNGIIFFLDLSTGSYLETFQTPSFRYSETDLNLLNKNWFLQMLFFVYFSLHLALLFFPSLPKVDVNLRLPEQVTNVKQNTSACHVCLSRKSISTPEAIKHPSMEAISKSL